MSKRDERLAAKYAAKGMRSASETSNAKSAARKERQSGGTSDVEQALRNFDPGNPKPVERSDASRERARGHQASARFGVWGRKS